MNPDLIAGLAIIALAVALPFLYYPTWLVSRARHQEPSGPVRGGDAKAGFEHLRGRGVRHG